MWLIMDPSEVQPPDTVDAMEDVVATIDGLDEELSSDAISIRSLLKSGSLKFEVPLICQAAKRAFVLYGEVRKEQ